jgi:hypothetical protein
MLAGLRTDNRPYVLCPAPSGLKDEATDGDLVELHDLDDTAREFSDLVGFAKSFSL